MTADPLTCQNICANITVHEKWMKRFIRVLRFHPRPNRLLARNKFRFSIFKFECDQSLSNAHPIRATHACVLLELNGKFSHLRFQNFKNPLRN